MSEKSCGTCKHFASAQFGPHKRGRCYATVSDEDLQRVAAILPAACIKNGVQWRAELEATDGAECPKWETKAIAA